MNNNIKLFKQTSEYNAFVSGEDFSDSLPNVSAVKEEIEEGSSGVHYNPQVVNDAEP